MSWIHWNFRYIFLNHAHPFKQKFGQFVCHQTRPNAHSSLFRFLSLSPSSSISALFEFSANKWPRLSVKIVQVGKYCTGIIHRMIIGDDWKLLQMASFFKIKCLYENTWVSQKRDIVFLLHFLRHITGAMPVIQLSGDWGNPKILPPSWGQLKQLKIVLGKPNILSGIWFRLVLSYNEANCLNHAANSNEEELVQTGVT